MAYTVKFQLLEVEVCSAARARQPIVLPEKTSGCEKVTWMLPKETKAPPPVADLPCGQLICASLLLLLKLET